jgi:glucokinase
MKSKKSFAIGVDLGATTVKTGIVETNGSISDQISFESKADKGPAVVIQQIIFSIQQVLGKHELRDCKGIGIGTPGVVSSKDGTVQHPPNFANWTSVDVAKKVRQSFPVPVHVENDANCAALAEARFGAGIEFKDFLFVIWGTGVGGGIILNHRLFHGPDGGAGEIGHLSIDYNGAACNCGGTGCIESYIGQRYLSQRTREILKTLGNDEREIIVKLVNGNLDKIEPAIISKAAELGDPTAISILKEAGTLLGAALASIMNVLDLEVAVIGGGISAAPAFVYEEILSSVRARVLKPHKAGVKVVRALLGNNAGIIGAASLVL